MNVAFPQAVPVLTGFPLEGKHQLWIPLGTADQENCKEFCSGQLLGGVCNSLEPPAEWAYLFPELQPAPGISSGIPVIGLSSKKR